MISWAEQETGRLSGEFIELISSDRGNLYNEITKHLTVTETGDPGPEIEGMSRYTLQMQRGEPSITVDVDSRFIFIARAVVSNSYSGPFLETRDRQTGITLIENIALSIFLKLGIRPQRRTMDSSGGPPRFSVHVLSEYLLARSTKPFYNVDGVIDKKITASTRKSIINASAKECLERNDGPMLPLSELAKTTRERLAKKLMAKYKEEFKKLVLDYGFQFKEKYMVTDKITGNLLLEKFRESMDSTAHSAADAIPESDIVEALKKAVRDVTNIKIKELRDKIHETYSNERRAAREAERLNIYSLYSLIDVLPEGSGEPSTELIQKYCGREVLVGMQAEAFKWLQYERELGMPNERNKSSLLEVVYEFAFRILRALRSFISALLCDECVNKYEEINNEEIGSPKTIGHDKPSAYRHETLDEIVEYAVEPPSGDIDSMKQSMINRTVTESIAMKKQHKSRRSMSTPCLRGGDEKRSLNSPNEVPDSLQDKASRCQSRPMSVLGDSSVADRSNDDYGQYPKY